MRAGVIELIDGFDSLDALIAHGLAAIKADDKVGQLDTRADALLAAQLIAVLRSDLAQRELSRRRRQTPVNRQGRADVSPAPVSAPSGLGLKDQGRVLA